MRKRVRIGELLVQNQVITEQQLKTALVEQKKRGTRLGRALVDLGYIDEDRLLNLLSMQLQIPFIDLTSYSLKPEIVDLLPETHARRFRAIPLEDTGNEILVGMADPADLFASDELTRILKRPIKQAVVRESALLRTIDDAYRRAADFSLLATELQTDLGDQGFDIAELAEAGEDTEAPVFKLLQSIFEEAVRASASDIHIEPDTDVLRIRQRVDGILQESVINEKRIAAPLVLRLKLMCGLNISEKRLPQDGRFHIQVGERGIDVRLSSMPVRGGESIVMRLLDQSESSLVLDQLGIPDRILTRFRTLIHRPNGLILVTGPTGSGKTTTLYAALNELNQPEAKIITVEDPVEYELERINQVQVNPKIGLTFAGVLRAALRQDPDIVLVGEMRDAETAEIGIRAAMTGHLVLSSLHTNDAIGSATRLTDMGIEGYIAATALRAMIAQRLVRKVCSRCVEEFKPDGQQLSWLRTMVGPQAGDLEFKKGKGCGQCNNGYSGRLGVYELLEMDEAMADALRREDTEGYSQAAKASAGYKCLAECALDYALEGITTLEEVFRVSSELEETAEGPPLAKAPDAPAEGEAAADPEA